MTSRGRSFAALFVLILLPTPASLAADAESPRAEDWPRERLVELLRDLADESFELFVVRDPKRPVYGMTYEFVVDGKHTQAFGLDSMHDGAWLMNALVTAHRVDPEGRYLARAQRFQVPFYVNVLTNSDRLFPHMIPREGQEEFDAPITGWAPRGWDDGPGIDLPTGKPYSAGEFVHPESTAVERDAEGNFQHAYFTSSHHLLQDLADSLMNVWLTTRDPAVAKAILLIHEGRMQHGRRIPVVQTAAGLTNDLPELHRRSSPPEFDPAQGLRPLWQGLVLRETEPMGHYSDGLAWTYGEECARAALGDGDLADGFTANAAGRTYAAALTTEAFFTPDDYRHGYTLFPRAIRFENGRLARHYDGNGMMFARGMQYAWIAAAVLPEFRAEPDAWNDGLQPLQKMDSLERLKSEADKLGVKFHDDPQQVARHLDAYVLGTIDYWAGVREKLGYLPRGYFPDGRNATWVRRAELGAYAHLMKLVAYRLMQLDGKTEWELIRAQTPAEPLRHEPLPASVRNALGLE